MGDKGSGDMAFLERLFVHNRWANLKLIDFCAGLTEDQLSATTTGTFGSIRETLAHLFRAEIDYVCRVTGGPLPQWVSDRQWPGFEQLKEDAQRSGEALGQMADRARGQDMVRETDPEEGLWAEYPVTALLVQAINHATEHRTQVSAIITSLGLEPPNMDGWALMEETGEFREGTLS
jgi:uncharacterized damage-inducible protein DinB